MFACDWALVEGHRSAPPSSADDGDNNALTLKNKLHVHISFVLYIYIKFSRIPSSPSVVCVCVKNTKRKSSPAGFVGCILWPDGSPSESAP